MNSSSSSSIPEMIRQKMLKNLCKSERKQIQMGVSIFFLLFTAFCYLNEFFQSISGAKEFNQFRFGENIPR